MISLKPKYLPLFIVISACLMVLNLSEEYYSTLTHTPTHQKLTILIFLLMIIYIWMCLIPRFLQMYCVDLCFDNPTENLINMICTVQNENVVAPTLFKLNMC